MSDDQPKNIVPKKSVGFLSKISGLAKRGLDVAQNPTNVQYSSSLSQFLDSIGGIPEDNRDRRFREINQILQNYFSKMTMDEISNELQAEYQKRPNGRILKLLGFSYFHLGRLDDAIRAYTRTLEITEENPVAIYEDLGRCYILKGDWDQAKLWFQKSVRYDYEFFLHVFGYDFLFVAAVGRHKSRPPIFGELNDEFSTKVLRIEAMADAISIYHGNKKGHKSLANAQVESIILEVAKEYATNQNKVNQDIETIGEEASQLFQELKASKIDTEIYPILKRGLNVVDAMNYSKVGKFLTNRNQWKEAEDAFRKAIAADPNNADAYLGLGNLFARQNLLKQAEEAWQKAVVANPNLGQAYCNLGVIFESQSRLIEAENAYSKVLATDPNFPQAFTNLGLLLANRNRQEEAENCYQKAIKVDPNYLLAYFNLGVLLVNQNRLEEAENAYRRAIAIDPNDAPSYLNLSILLSNQDRSKEAFSMLQKAHRLDSKLVDNFLEQDK